MTAGEYAKSRGVTISQMAKASGKDRKTIYNWYNDNPKLFSLVIDGIHAGELKASAYRILSNIAAGESNGI